MSAQVIRFRTKDEKDEIDPWESIRLSFLNSSLPLSAEQREAAWSFVSAIARPRIEANEEPFITPSEMIHCFYRAECIQPLGY